MEVKHPSIAGGLYVIEGQGVPEVLFIQLLKEKGWGHLLSNQQQGSLLSFLALVDEVKSSDSFNDERRARILAGMIDAKLKQIQAGVGSGAS